MPILSSRARHILPYVAPAVLSAVALSHCYLVYVSRLSPWKGGGFGMFSTIESPGSRLLKIYLATKDGRISVLLPNEFRRLERPIRTMPTSESLQQLAYELSKGTWVPYRLVPAEEHYQGLKREHYSALPEPGRLDDSDWKANRYSLENRAYLDMLFERMRLLRMLRKSERGQPSVPFERVDVEVWQMRFDHRKAQLSVDLILKNSAKRHD